MLGEVYNVILELDAELDFAQAMDYYLMQSERAAHNFIANFRRATASLSKVTHHQIRYKNIRCFKVGRYPYQLHYTIDEAAKEIRIQATLHEKQDSPLRN